MTIPRRLAGAHTLHNTRHHRGEWLGREGQKVQHHSKGHTMARSVLKGLVAGSNSFLHLKYYVSQANSKIGERH